MELAGRAARLVPLTFSLSLLPLFSVVDSSSHPTFREAFWVWCRVAALSFGGPTAQIAVMHRLLVEEKKWISEHRFLHALNYCMLLPGPEAQQLAVYIGWLLHGTRGGLVAGTLFILPGFVAIMLLSVLYVYAQSGAHQLIAVSVAAVLFGMKPAVAAIVAEAVVRIGRKVLKNRIMVLVAAFAFIAIFFFELPFPLIIAGAGVFGLIGGHFWPQFFEVIHAAQSENNSEHRAVDAAAVTRRVSLLRTVEVLAIWLTLWFAPLLFLGWYFGRDSVFVQEGVFFSKAAMVTFGGAYSVLSYIGQQAVGKYAWLKPQEMMDGLSMAETTPGPLIMVVQFVGFMGAYRNPGDLPPLAAGILGAVITVWVTFVPCFLWIFLGAPYIEKLRGLRLLNSALSTITAAVVGVVLNLAIWFMMHTLFTDVREHHQTLLGFSGLWEAPSPPGTQVGAPSHFVLSFRWFEPQFSSLSKGSLLILLFAATLTFRFKAGLFAVLGFSVLFGVLFYLTGVR